MAGFRCKSSKGTPFSVLQFGRGSCFSHCTRKVVLWLESRHLPKVEGHVC